MCPIHSLGKMGEWDHDAHILMEDQRLLCRGYITDRLSARSRFLFVCFPRIGCLLLPNAKAASRQVAEQAEATPGSRPSWEVGRVTFFSSISLLTVDGWQTSRAAIENRAIDRRVSSGSLSTSVLFWD